ncbi:MAG: ribosome silencing factor [Actinobacteria bacterium]|nr:ribosome silencing factor [Actinomycetota bacterium]
MTPERRDTPREWVLRLATLAARAASDKLGVDTVVLEVGQVLAITDAFVITSGANSRQVRTIAEEVEKAVKADDGPSPMRVEGLDDARWVLLDYGDFVVHVFLEEARRFYDLERLWSDAPRVRWNDRESGGGSEGDGDGDGDQALDAASS